MVNIIYYPIFSKLKRIFSRIHLLRREFFPEFIFFEHRKGNSKVFENIQIIGIKKGISVIDILVRDKVALLENEGGFYVSIPAINQDMKFINILPKHINLNHYLGSAYVPWDQRLWITLLTDVHKLTELYLSKCYLYENNLCLL